MQRFVYGNNVPAGGFFFYADPENGVPLIKDRDPTMLKQKLHAAYAKAGKPVPEDLQIRIEDYICRHVPEGFCYGEASGPRAWVLTPQQVKSRTVEYARMNGRVDPGTIKKRMAICGTCKYNNKNLCITCTGLQEFAAKLAGRTVIGMDDSMGICAADRVLLTLLVSVDIPQDTLEGRPENCWRLKSCPLTS